MQRALLFDTLADVLAYPGVEYRVHMARAVALLRTLHAHPFADAQVRIEGADLDEAVASLERFAAATADLTTSGFEELYTRTFDINPACALELGWHLHGESYDRGAFLVRMRSLLARFELAESGELPDHICHALAVFGRMPDDEARVFARETLRPAITPMREALGTVDNPYDNVLAAVEATLHTWCTHPAGVSIP